MSSDHLVKHYKDKNQGILSNARKLKNIEPTEDELLVSNNNLAINEILNNIKLKTAPN